MPAASHRIASRPHVDSFPVIEERRYLRLCQPDKSQIGHEEPVRAVFSPLEKTVIEIGNRDPLGLAKPGSLSGRLQRLLFGIEAPLAFADRRLEALRRLALASRRSARRFEAEAARALQAGVAPEQINHLRSCRR